MKKHKFCFISNLIKAISILTMTVLVGCKTVPSNTVVEPISLLDSNSAFYIAAPSKADPELVKRIIVNNVTNISSKDAAMISERIKTVYAGLNHSKKETTLQVAVDANIPQKFIPKILSKKNGWNSTAYAPNGGKVPYSIYTPTNSSAFDMAFPSDKIAVLGRDVKNMINTYDSIHQIPAEQSIGKEYYNIDDNIYNWLMLADSDIRFYASKPQSFLTILTGANLDLKLVDVKGSFVSDPKYEKQYLLTLEFNFKKEAYMKAGKTLLTLAFGLTSSQAEAIDKTTLRISNIQINKEQLYKLLIL